MSKSTISFWQEYIASWTKPGRRFFWLLWTLPLLFVEPVVSQSFHQGHLIGWRFILSRFCIFAAYALVGGILIVTNDRLKRRPRSIETKGGSGADF